MVATLDPAFRMAIAGEMDACTGKLSELNRQISLLTGKRNTVQALYDTLHAMLRADDDLLQWNKYNA